MLKTLNVLSAVFKTKLRPRFTRPFTDVAEKGQTHTLYLPRKLRTQRVLSVGMLKPYRDPIHVGVEALAPRKADVSQPTYPPSETADVPAFADAFAPLPPRSELKPTSHGDVTPREATHRVSCVDTLVSASIAR